MGWSGNGPSPLAHSTPPRPAGAAPRLVSKLSACDVVPAAPPSAHCAGSQPGHTAASWRPCPGLLATHLPGLEMRTLLLTESEASRRGAV